MAIVNPKSNQALMAPKRRQKKNFFSLPGELRNKIYREVLIQNQGIIMNQHRYVISCSHTSTACTDIFSLDQMAREGPPPLLLATPQAGKESASIYWQENTFCFAQDTLSEEHLNWFESLLGNHVKGLTKIGVSRHFKIGDADPIKIRMLVEIINGRIVIVRPKGEVRPFPGCAGFAKFRSPYTEPCRCEVRRLAVACMPGQGKKPNGYHLLNFMSKYVEMVRTKAKSVYFETCNTCKSVRRR